VILAVAATLFLAVGARLLDGTTSGSATLAIVMLVIGTALAATAVAGAWRPPQPRDEREPDVTPLRSRSR
jgi:hypothetical protein